MTVAITWRFRWHMYTPNVTLFTDERNVRDHINGYELFTQIDDGGFKVSFCCKYSNVNTHSHSDSLADELMVSGDVMVVSICPSRILIITLPHCPFVSTSWSLVITDLIMLWTCSIRLGAPYHYHEKISILCLHTVYIYLSTLCKICLN